MSIRQGWLARLFARTPPYEAQIDPSAEFVVGAGTLLQGSRIRVGRNAVLRIGRGSVVNAVLSVHDGCQVTIGDGCQVANTVLTVQQASRVHLSEGARIAPPQRFPAEVAVDRGTLEIGPHAWVQSDLLVRFGGHMKIGAYAGISYGGDIRCEEQVTIGDYAMISYEVCIYDTNTHSTDWRKRRAVIERMRQSGTGEVEKPDTRPVHVGDDVWIGRGAVVLKGSRLGDRSIVGIRTVVSGVYPADTTLVSTAPRTFSRVEGSLGPCA
jgi:acetyltransferase-like isoleucine patch superfamily enzyme